MLLRIMLILKKNREEKLEEEISILYKPKVDLKAQRMLSNLEIVMLLQRQKQYKIWQNGILNSLMEKFQYIKMHMIKFLIQVSDFQVKTFIFCLKRNKSFTKIIKYGNKNTRKNKINKFSHKSQNKLFVNRKKQNKKL